MTRRAWLPLGLVVGVLVLGSASAAAGAISESQDRIAWVDQFGTPGFDFVDGMAADSIGAYATGRVEGGALPGQTSYGGADAFVRRYASDGTVDWTRQFGTAGYDGYTKAVANGDSIFVTGVTNGVFPGATSAGGTDVFLARFSTGDGGLEQPIQQFGTAGADFPLAIAADADNLYIVGMTTGKFAGQSSLGGWDFFLAKLTKSGDLEWVKQFGTAADDPAIFTLAGVAVDGTGIYVDSTVASPLPDETGSFAESDGFIRKYSLDGQEVLWTQGVGTACLDEVSSVALGSGGLFLAGATTGDINQPYSKGCTQPPEVNRDLSQFPHAFLQLRNPDDGSIVWSREFDGHGINADHGYSTGIALAADNNVVYLTSEANRTPAAHAQDKTCFNSGTGEEDIHTRAYDTAGNALWTQVIGSAASDSPSGIAVNGSGVYVGGGTACELPGQTNIGSYDAVVLKILR